MKNKNNKPNNIKGYKTYNNTFKYLMPIRGLFVLLVLFGLISFGVGASWDTYQNNLQSTGVQFIPYEIPDNMSEEYKSDTCNQGNGYQIQTGNFDDISASLEFVVMCGSEIMMYNSSGYNISSYDFGSGEMGGHYDLEDLDGDGVEEIIFVRETGTNAGNFTIMKYNKTNASFSVVVEFEINEDYASVRCLSFAGEMNCFVNDGDYLRAFNLSSTSVSDDWLNVSVGTTISSRSPIVFADFNNDSVDDICLTNFDEDIICINESKDISFNYSLPSIVAGVQNFQIVYDNEYYFLIGWWDWSVNYYAGLSLIDSSGNEDLNFYISGSGSYNRALVWMDDIDEDGDNEFCLYGTVNEVDTKVICKENDVSETIDVNQDVDDFGSDQHNMVLINISNELYENYTGYQWVAGAYAYGFNESLDVVKLVNFTDYYIPTGSNNYMGWSTLDDLDGDGDCEYLLSPMNPSIGYKAIRMWGLSGIITINNMEISITKDSSILELGIDNNTINWTTYDADGIDFAEFNVTYPNGSLIFESNSENGNVLLQPTNLTVEGNYSIYLFANDTLGNSNSTSDIFEVLDINHLPVIEDFNLTPPFLYANGTVIIDNFNISDADVNDTEFQVVIHCGRYPNDFVNTSFGLPENLSLECSYDNISANYDILMWVFDRANENWTLATLGNTDFEEVIFGVRTEYNALPEIVSYGYSSDQICSYGGVDFTVEVTDVENDTDLRWYVDCDGDNKYDKIYYPQDNLSGSCYLYDIGFNEITIWVTDLAHWIDDDYIAGLNSISFTKQVENCSVDNMLPYIESLTPSIPSGTPICLDQELYFDNFSVYDYENETEFIIHYECEEDARTKIHTGLVSEDVLAGTCNWDYVGDKKITIWIADEAHRVLDEYPYESLQSYSMEYTLIDAGLCVSNIKPTIDSWTFKPTEHICVNNTLMGYNFSVTDLDNDNLFQLYVDCEDGEGITIYAYNSENSLTFICNYENAGVYNITAWITDVAHEEFDYTSFNNYTISYEVWDNASCVEEVYNTSDSICEGHCLFKDYFPYDDPYFLHGWSILDSQLHYDYWSFPFANEMYFSEHGRRYLRVRIENNGITPYPISTLSFNLTLYEDDEFSLKLLDYYNDLDEPITELVWINSNIQYQEKDKRFVFSSSPYLCESCYVLNQEYEYKIQIYWNMESITTYDRNNDDYSLVVYIDGELIDIIPFAMSAETIAIKEGYTGSLDFEKGYTTKFSLDEVYYYRGTNPDFDNTDLIIFTNQSVEFDRGFGGWDSEGKFNCQLYPECCAMIDGELKVVKTFCPYKTIFAGMGGWILSWIKSNPLLFILTIGCFVIIIPIWLKTRGVK